MVFKHEDDNGDLSVFASGEEVLFACNKGHYWIVAAKSGAVAAPTRKALAERDVVDLDALTKTFGAGLAEALGIE